MEIRDFMEAIMGHQTRNIKINYTPRVSRLITAAVLVVVAVIGLSTAIYTVPTDSAGVVKRFGKYNRTTEPGIHLMLPFWVETATAVPVKRVQKEEFGFRTLKAG
ncbi:MAG: SPFH domain-containing protein, partial [Planctomycetota bacterium]